MFDSFYVYITIVLASKTVNCYLEVVNKNNKIIQSFKHNDAEISGTVSTSGMKGRLIYLRMTNGSCNDYEPVAPVLNGNHKPIALMERTGCKFVDMVYAAQNLNYSAVIVRNNKANGNKLVRMLGSSVPQHYHQEVLTTVSPCLWTYDFLDNSFGLLLRYTDVVVPVVFVGYHTGIKLGRYIYNMKNNSEYFIRLTPNENASKPVVPTYASIIAGVLFLVLTVCVVTVYCYEQIGSGNAIERFATMHLLRSSMEYLRHIRQSSFSNDDAYEVCPICLENFVTQETLWKLPCDHQFHINCIKPCLEAIDVSCPVCRHMFTNHEI